MLKRPRFLALGSVLLLSQAACLKTRAQLREEEDTRGVQANVQDVQPQGEYVIDELKSEITRLTGRIEDLERAQKQDAKKEAGAAKDEVKRLEGRIVELEQAQANMLEAIKKMEHSATSSADPGELLERAKAAFKSEKYEAAVEELDAYLKSPKAKKVEEALLLRGESHFHLKQFKKAIVDFSKFPEKYTKSSKMPEALYRIGQSFEALGMKDDAKGFYQELVEKFPKSPEAKRLKKKK